MLLTGHGGQVFEVVFVESAGVEVGEGNAEGDDDERQNDGHCAERRRRPGRLGRADR